MINFYDLLVKRLKKEEGLRLVPYTDIFGNITIGWGHNYGKIDLSLVQPISIQKAEQLFAEDLRTAINVAKKLFYNFETLSENRKIVLCDMAFNLGEHGLAVFLDFIFLVTNNYFLKAADDLRHNTKVYKQLPRRYEELAQLLEKG